MGCEASNPGEPRGIITIGSEEEKKNPPVDPSVVLGPQTVREEKCIAWPRVMLGMKSLTHALIKVKYRCFTTMKSSSGFVGQVIFRF